jgi:hypothetical protein
MAYDERLAERARRQLVALADIFEKRMFGGVGFLLCGNMACGVHGDRLIVRVGPEGYEAALAEPHVAPFDMTGRPMRGWVTVGPEGYAADADLRDWLQRGLEFASTLPAK